MKPRSLEENNEVSEESEPLISTQKDIKYLLAQRVQVTKIWENVRTATMLPALISRNQRKLFYAEIRFELRNCFRFLTAA